MRAFPAWMERDCLLDTRRSAVVLVGTCSVAVPSLDSRYPVVGKVPPCPRVKRGGAGHFGPAPPCRVQLFERVAQDRRLRGDGVAVELEILAHQELDVLLGVRAVERVRRDSRRDQAETDARRCEEGRSRVAKDGAPRLA